MIFHYFQVTYQIIDTDNVVQMVTYSLEHSEVMLDHMIISFVSSAVVIKAKVYKPNTETFNS